MIDSSSLYELNNAPFAANVFDHYNYSRDANYGNWANNGQGNTGFMGFSFTDSLGLLHYAWADIGISPYQDGNLFSYRISVYGYAYETLANDGILAGATINASPVPVPSAIWMFGSSLVGFVGFNRRKAIQQ
jgi:hypothetical protein